MRLKICGLREHKQILKIESLIKPDFLGFIFYPDSPRYVGENFIMPELKDDSIRKVGVFVKEEIEELVKAVSKHGLDYVQLHGDEDVDYVKKVKEQGLKIIKVFRVGPDFQIGDIEKFNEYADLYLFDTRVKDFGGSGLPFDWKILENYAASKPFMVGGGISLENIDGLAKVKSEYFMGIDVNSAFENAPADKNIDKLIALKEKMDEIFG